jgi:D-glycerate 3-kinase
LTASCDLVAASVGTWLKGAPRPLVLGICGAQGSGKSTLAQGLEARLAAQGLKVASLSLDDLYLGRAARAELAAELHPLFATRGVPGTHDVVRGLSVIDAVRGGEAVALPRFDKASDEPVARKDWPVAPAGLDVLIFEGWCVGARPQDAAVLADPVNPLERDEDAEGRWRRAVNDCLSKAYQQLFDRIDRLVLLAAPGFDVVHGWRLQQERGLREQLRSQGRDPALAMSDDEIARFISHYERITRHILSTMPDYADLTLRLGHGREILEIEERAGLSSS